MTNTLRIISLIFICNALPILANDPLCNITQWGGPVGAGIDCSFPFVLNGITFNMCTTAAEGDNRPWCPTETKEDGTYSLGNRNWGYCDASCPFMTAAGVAMEATTKKPRRRRPRPSRPSTPPPVTFSTTTTTSTTTTLPDPSLTYEETNPDSLKGTWLPSADLFECGYSLIRTTIVGGEQTERGEFPFMALLGYNQNGRRTYLCGGTLINRLYVLTAAHCHKPGKLEIAEVVIGEWDLGFDPDCDNSCRKAQRFNPVNVTLHDTWKNSRPRSGEDDIALVRLDRPVTTTMEDLNEVVLPVCLDSPFPPPRAEELVVAGWGKTTNDPIQDIEDFKKLGASVRVLQKLVVPYYEFKRCRAYFTRIKEDRMFCAGGEEGPLLARKNYNSIMYLVGIVSSGTSYCGAGQPGVYTRVAHYHDWIKQHLMP